jgi:hypothetical protein
MLQSSYTRRTKSALSVVRPIRLPLRKARNCAIAGYTCVHCSRGPDRTGLSSPERILRTGGTGVTPFVRILRKLRVGGSRAPTAAEVCVVTSNRCAADILYAQELAAMGGTPRNPRSAD